MIDMVKIIQNILYKGLKMNKFQSIRSQMAIIEQNGLLKDVLSNIGLNEDKKWYSYRSSFRCIGWFINLKIDSKIESKLVQVSEETYVNESFTINEFKGFLKSIYGKDYPEYFI